MSHSSARAPQLVVALALLAAAHGAAQDRSEKKQDLAAEILALKEGQRAIQLELAEIRKLLQGLQPARAEPQAPLRLDIGDAYQGGNPEATLVLIEFADYECPFCARHVNQVMPQVDRDFIKPGKLRYAFRNFPLEELHPRAHQAAEAAECAGDQGRFWEMHQLLFDNSTALARADLARYAETLGLDLPRFQRCIEDGTFAARIRGEKAEGLRAGVSGTPTLLIGVAKPRDRWVTTAKTLVGLRSYQELRQTLESFLAEKAESAAKEP